MLCITFYNGRIHFYNHNIVLLLANVGAAWLAYLAITQRQLRWWIGLGVVLGLGALSKYQIAVTGFSLLAFWLSQHGWRDPSHRRGLTISILVGLLVFLPHLQWLAANDFGPIRYAMATSLGLQLAWPARTLETAHWVIDQVLNRALPAWIMLLVVAEPWRRSDPAAKSDLLEGTDVARWLILCWGLIPIAFTAALGLMAGAYLEQEWGTAFLLFLVPAMMELMRWPEDLSTRRLRRAFRTFLMLQGVLMLVNVSTSHLGPWKWRASDWSNFDAKALAADIAGPAHLALDGPVRVIVGPGDIAGAMALQLPERPLVLIDGRYDVCPWVAQDLVNRCGAIRISGANALKNGLAVGTDFPNLRWQPIAPLPGAGHCGSRNVDADRAMPVQIAPRSTP